MQRQYSPLCFLGKIAIITGGSRGIDAGIALELATRGADVGAEDPYLTLKLNILGPYNISFP